jgi:antitoxin HigA-1
MARIIIHPGEHLADELKALGMSANGLAKELGVPTNRLTQIIRGKRGISGDTALRLGRWFGTSRISGLTCKKTMNCEWPRLR